ncbi:MAG: DMT family transporter [Chromatiales bacterium]|nr:DMT family transporter [Chromatiales bacterium]
MTSGSALLPAVFVLLWCTGYLVVPIAMPDAGPVRFLALRFGLAAVLLAAAALALRAPWARRAADYGHMAVVGLLLHAIGLGGVWVALDIGVETGVAALIMGTQPLITAALAVGFIGERIDRRAAAGLALGFLGVTLVIHRKLSGIGDPAGLAAVVVAVISMTLGMLYQKRRCAHIDLVTSTTVQLSFAAVGAFTVAWWIGDRPVEWSVRIAATLGWSVLVLSIGATIVLYMLLRRGEASRVASLLYLVPPLTAVMAWIGFGERLAPLTIAGMVLTATGVALVAGPGAPTPVPNRPARTPDP